MTIAPENLSELHERLRTVAGRMSYREMAEVGGGVNAETARRYLMGQPPSVEFLAGICRLKGISAEWMLTGRGPMRVQDFKAHALKEANASELLTAVAGSLERLADRVERLELYVHSLEARLRTRPMRAIPLAEVKLHERTNPSSEGHPTNASPPHAGGDAGASAAAGGERARRVADAVPQRPRQDHH